MTTYSQPKPVGMPTWIDLSTPDPEASRAFYQAVFGWEYEISGPEYGSYATARLGGRMAAGIAGNMPGAPPMPAHWNLYFASTDAGGDVKRAADLGAKVLFPAMAIGQFGSMAQCQDPGGAAFGFWQAGGHIGAEVTDAPGSMTWRELYAPNAKAALDFYTALLGAASEPVPGGMEYYALKQSEEQFAGVMQIDRSWGDFQPQWVTYFAVANAEESVAAVTRHGGQAMSSIDESPFGRLAALSDPQGAFFKIVQLPAR
jgi:uncharacterized protein